MDRAEPQTGTVGTTRARVAAAMEAQTENPRIMWLALGALFFFGGTIGTISLVLPHPESFNDTQIWSNIALAYAAAVICLLASARLPAWAVQLFLVGGSFVITRAVYFS